MSSKPISTGMMDQIRCDQKEYLIWKWRPDNNAHRENAIRWGSSLRVREGSVAVFVYRQKGGELIQEYIEGPFDKTLETSNLPIIANLVALAYGGGTPFQAEVYFINLAKVLQSKFAVRYFDVFDPRYPEFGIPVAVRGTITYCIADYQRFIKLHRLDEFDATDLQSQIKDHVARKIKSIVANVATTQQLPIQQLENKTDDISQLAIEALSEKLNELFGVELSSVDIAAIDIDKDSEAFKQLMAVTRDITAATARAKAEAEIKTIHDAQQIKMQNLAEQLRIEREESQYGIHKQTQSSNMAAYQIEAQTAVGVAGAEALGRSGQAGGIASDSGLNMAGITAGIAIGGALGQNIAGNMNSLLGTSVQAPPPLPHDNYFVANGDKATGPFPVQTLQQMSTAGSLNASTLVWKQGMADWQSAGSIQELADLFARSTTPPPIPQQEK